jgi:hypothetical protein
MTRPANVKSRRRGPDVVLARVHPPSDLFERVVAAIAAEGFDVDLQDLRDRLERFRVNLAATGERLSNRSGPERWELLAAGIESALGELEAGRPDFARAALDAGLGAYIEGAGISRPHV